MVSSRNHALMVWHPRFIKAAVFYNLAVFAIFSTVYLSTDFSTHFTSESPVTTRGKLYYAVMAHAAGGCNDIVPKTDTARLITSLHVAMVWMQLLLAFLG